MDQEIARKRLKFSKRHIDRAVALLELDPPALVDAEREARIATALCSLGANAIVGTARGAIPTCDCGDPWDRSYRHAYDGAPCRSLERVDL